MLDDGEYNPVDGATHTAVFGPCPSSSLLHESFPVRGVFTQNVFGLSEMLQPFIHAASKSSVNGIVAIAGGAVFVISKPAVLAVLPPALVHVTWQR